MDVLGCANPDAVNTFRSHSPFIWLFVLGLLLSSSHSLAGFITVLCNRVYLANSRNSPLSHYCLMAADVAFLKGEELNPVLLHTAGNNCQRCMSL